MMMLTTVSLHPLTDVFRRSIQISAVPQARGIQKSRSRLPDMRDLVCCSVELVMWVSAHRCPCHDGRVLPGSVLQLGHLQALQWLELSSSCGWDEASAT